MKLPGFVVTLALCAASAALSAAPIASTISRADFDESFSTDRVRGYVAFAVGDGLSPLASTGEPELFAGVTRGNVSATAQFDWPVNWMSSVFRVQYAASTGSMSLSLISGDVNSRPGTATVTTAVGDFDAIYLGGHASVAAMYVFPLRLDGESIGSLTPNGYYPALGSGFSGIALDRGSQDGDFTIDGLLYFDGGYQTGDSNGLEIALVDTNQVPEPGSFPLTLAAALCAALASGWKRHQVLVR